MPPLQSAQRLDKPIVDADVSVFRLNHNALFDWRFDYKKLCIATCETGPKERRASLALAFVIFVARRR